MIICVCHAISSETILNCSNEQLKKLGLGRTCGKCIPYLKELKGNKMNNTATRSDRNKIKDNSS